MKPKINNVISSFIINSHKASRVPPVSFFSLLIFVKNRFWGLWSLLKTLRHPSTWVFLHKNKIHLNQMQIANWILKALLHKIPVCNSMKLTKSQNKNNSRWSNKKKRWLNKKRKLNFSHRKKKQTCDLFQICDLSQFSELSLIVLRSVLLLKRYSNQGWIDDSKNYDQLNA